MTGSVQDEEQERLLPIDGNKTPEMSNAKRLGIMSVLVVAAFLRLFAASMVQLLTHSPLDTSGS